MGLGDLSVTKSLFGSGSSPGVMGTGQQRFNAPQMGNVKRDKNGNPIMDVTKQPGESDEDYTHRAERWFNGDESAGNVVYETDPYKAWQDPMAEQRRGELAGDKTKYENRQLTGDARIDRGAIERFSGTSIADAERYGGAQVGEYERGRAQQLAAAERVGDINIGQAREYGGAQVDPAAQARAAQLERQDAQFRGGQTRLQSQLEEQAAGRGPSLAAGQLREATDRNLAQQAGAAAAGGGAANLARRQLATGAAQANQQAGRDAAQMRIQEQMAARQQLQGVTQTGREQDINVATTQAQLQQQAGLANQAAINTRAAQQAGLSQQAGLAGAESYNARQLQQAQLNAQLRQGNQAAANQFALTQGQFGQQMNMANMEQYNQRQALQAQMQQQAGLANQQQANQFSLQQGAWAQQAGLANQQYSNQALFANQQAALQNQQMNDQMARYMTEAGLGLDARQQQAMMAFQKQQQETALGYAGLEQKAYEGAREGIGGMMGGIGGMIGGLAMMSDEEVKGSVTRGDDKIGDFLDQYGSNEAAGQIMNAPEEKKSSGGLFGGMSSGMMSAGAMSAMSDQKAKDLSIENDKLKAQMVGQSMSSGAGGKGFFGGLGAGMAAGAKASMAKDASTKANAPKKIDPSSTMTPVMNNPNAAIAVPGGRSGAAMMAPSYGGLPVRENPYGAGPAMQTWGVPPPEPVYTPPPAGNMEIQHMDPYSEPLQTWSDKSMKSYSPVGMKQGVGSGDMKISNFLSSMNGAGSGPSNPTDYGEMSDKSTKKEIDKAIDDKISNFLNTQEAYEYEYKDKYKNLPGAGQGRFVSPMAQDLQKTELGKSMVTPGPDGKLQVDYGKGFGTILAAQSYLNERLNELEAEQSPKKGKR